MTEVPYVGPWAFVQGKCASVAGSATFRPEPDVSIKVS